MGGLESGPDGHLRPRPAFRLSLHPLHPPGQLEHVAVIGFLPKSTTFDAKKEAIETMMANPFVAYARGPEGSPECRRAVSADSKRLSIHTIHPGQVGADGAVHVGADLA